MNDLMETLKLNPASLRQKSKTIKTHESDFLFVNATHQNAYNLLVEGIRQHRGLLILTGEAGMGKTLLLRKLISQPPANMQFVFCHAAHLDFEGLLRAITEQLGLENARASGHALVAIKQYLGNRFTQDIDVALLIDEANQLNPQVLDTLLDLVRGQRKEGHALQIILSGTAGLEEMLVKSRTFQAYLASAIYIRLEPFAAADLKTFISRPIKEADGPLMDSLFPASLFERINHHTGGAPRLVDRLCEHALFLAHLNGQQTVTAALIDEAASELMLQPRKTAPSSGKDIVSAEITRSGNVRQAAEMERLLTQSENLLNDDTQSMPVKSESMRELERHLEEWLPRHPPKAGVKNANGLNLNGIKFLLLLLAALVAGLIGGLGSSYWRQPPSAQVEPRSPVAKPVETTAATATPASLAADRQAVPPIAPGPAPSAEPAATSATRPAAKPLEVPAPAIASAPPPLTAPVAGSPAPSPPAAAPPDAIAPATAGVIAAYLANGRLLMERKDVAAARLFYEAAANMGSGEAMVAVGTTYDPTILEQLAVKGFRADPVKAAEWYLKARQANPLESGQRLEGLKAWLSASATLGDLEANTLRQLLR